MTPAKLVVVAVEGPNEPGVGLICLTCGADEIIVLAQSGNVPLVMLSQAGDRHKERNHAPERG